MVRRSHRPLLPQLRVRDLEWASICLRSCSRRGCWENVRSIFRAKSPSWPLSTARRTRSTTREGPSAESGDRGRTARARRRRRLDRYRRRTVRAWSASALGTWVALWVERARRRAGYTKQALTLRKADSLSATPSDTYGMTGIFFTLRLVP